MSRIFNHFSIKSTSIPSKTRFRASMGSGAEPARAFPEGCRGNTGIISGISARQSPSGHQWAWQIRESHGIPCPQHSGPQKSVIRAPMGSSAEPAQAFPEGCRGLPAGFQCALAFGSRAVFPRIQRRNNPPRPQIRFFLIYLFTILRKSCIIISYIMTSEVFQWNSNTSAYS